MSDDIRNQKLVYLHRAPVDQGQFERVERDTTGRTPKDRSAAAMRGWETRRAREFQQFQEAQAEARAREARTYRAACRKLEAILWGDYDGEQQSIKPGIFNRSMGMALTRAANQNEKIAVLSLGVQIVNREKNNNEFFLPIWEMFLQDFVGDVLKEPLLSRYISFPEGETFTAARKKNFLQAKIRQAARNLSEAGRIGYVFISLLQHPSNFMRLTALELIPELSFCLPAGQISTLTRGLRLDPNPQIAAAAMNARAHLARAAVTEKRAARAAYKERLALLRSRQRRPQLER